jgi:trans-aconitate methyltransferase
MTSDLSDGTSVLGLPAKRVAEEAISYRLRTGPFIRWHLKTKFQAMEKLFRKHLTPNVRFVDMGCGNGDTLVLASLCEPQSEIWGMDIYPPDLEIAHRRLPNARLAIGNMLNPAAFPKGYFDIVHEFGAAYLVPDWRALARNYFSLLKIGGVLLWELPQKWSTGHISYLLSLAPKITDADTQIKRILRSFSPRKYTFESDAVVMRALEESGCDYEVLERVPIWHFYCRGILCKCADVAWTLGGDEMFERCDRFTSHIWPRYAGYYLVVRKKSAPERASI